MFWGTCYLFRRGSNALNWIEQENKRGYLNFNEIGSINEPQLRLINFKLQKDIFSIISVREKKCNLESKIIPRSLNQGTSSILESKTESWKLIGFCIE